ncbi:hypothetical protein ACH5RR_021438 [Cinchona calisaya]|uniref:Uncharacterized protein n=1 Tax=Cinchona calisaya TaxID=153742 RepID=A0ABD2ZHC2_9GENT
MPVEFESKFVGRGAKLRKMGSGNSGRGSLEKVAPIVLLVLAVELFLLEFLVGHPEERGEEKTFGILGYGARVRGEGFCSSILTGGEGLLFHFASDQFSALCPSHL